MMKSDRVSSESSPSSVVPTMNLQQAPDVVSVMLVPEVQCPTPDPWEGELLLICMGGSPHPHRVHKAPLGGLFLVLLVGRLALLSGEEESQEVEGVIKGALEGSNNHRGSLIQVECPHHRKECKAK